MDKDGIERLALKNGREAIIVRIQKDFNLTRILATAHYEQMEKYFQEHMNLKPASGMVCYEAVVKEELPGKSISQCIRKAVQLTLCHEDDLKTLKEKGLAESRRKRMLRLANESQEQGALLTHEDLANICCTSPSTVKRDTAKLRNEGYLVPTRGQMKDIGRGLSHKRKIVEMYLRNYQFTEIELRMHHSAQSITRYLKDFTQVALLTLKGLDADEIRLATGLSQRLVEEYQNLYREARNNGMTQRLNELLTQHSEKEKKRG